MAVVLVKNIPNVSDSDAHEVANKINRVDDVATKADLERMGRVIIMWVAGIAIVLFIGLSSLILGLLAS